MKRKLEEKQKAKLPRIQISKSDGTVTDWVRFWEQFEEEIDKSNQYASVTKFTYLREILPIQPKSEISGLPHTDDGYIRAKELLKQKVGVPSEIKNAHGRQIMNLPVIQKSETDPSILSHIEHQCQFVKDFKQIGHSRDTGATNIRQVRTSKNRINQN